MGTWGNGNFDNDGALDLLVMLTAQDTLKPVEDAFDAILAVDGYMDVDYGEHAVSAAEVVALLKGKPAEWMPESLAEWHQSHQLEVDGALIAKAIRAVEKATTDPKISEFREIREEGPGLPWYGYANIANLLERLRA